MADINVERPDSTAGERPGEQDAEAGDNDIVALIELLFFAYRDFVSDPDEILSAYSFGRAHHRIVHFVGRNPGMRVAELLDILRITKQSLGRVLRELIEQGFVVQKEGVRDRRQRLLYLTDEGIELHRRLIAPQIARVTAALRDVEPDAQTHYREILRGLIDPGDRAHVDRLVANRKPRAS